MRHRAALTSLVLVALTTGAQAQCGGSQPGCGEDETSCVSGQKNRKCKVGKNDAGYWVSCAGIAKRCANGRKKAARTDDSDPCMEDCDAQKNCAVHNNSSACVGEEKDKQNCTKLQNSTGYHIDAGVVGKCDNQDGCVEPNISASCIGAKLKCKQGKNMAGYIIDTNGEATRCANDKTIAAGNTSQTCADDCTRQVGCQTDQSDNNQPCIGTELDLLVCKDKQNKAGYSIKGGLVTRCANGKKNDANAEDSDNCSAVCDKHDKCDAHDNSSACVGPNKDKQNCTALRNNTAGYYLDVTGFVTQCRNQTGCLDHDVSATCINGTKLKCKAGNNADGYVVKCDGTAHRCANGRKIQERKNQTSCWELCDKQEKCKI